MNPVMEKIKSRGYWYVTIRPTEFIDIRIPELGICKSFIRDNRVTLRGWDYPHFDEKTEPTCGLNFVEQFTDWENYIEGWRFYQSGQFVHCAALREDWFEARKVLALIPDIPPNEYLSIIGTVYSITEMYEFASRLAAKGFLGDTCEIRIILRNTKDRKLVPLDPSRDFYEGYQTSLEELPRSVELATTDLMARSAEIALEHVAWLYQRFNWYSVNAGIFKEDQRELLEKRT